MNKRFFIIHGWEGSPEGAWRPWLKTELTKLHNEVHVPAMPMAAHPTMKEWTKFLSNLVKNPTEQCILIGHSLGCIAILRYIESLPENSKIGGVILIAGFTSNLGFEELDSFFKAKINWDKIKSICKKFIVLHSDNDYYVSLHYGDLFKKHLNAELIVKPGFGHFSDDQNIKKLPILIELIQQIS